MPKSLAIKSIHYSDLYLAIRAAFPRFQDSVIYCTRARRSVVLHPLLLACRAKRQLAIAKAALGAAGWRLFHPGHGYLSALRLGFCH